MVPGRVRLKIAWTPVLSAGMWSCPAVRKSVCHSLAELTDAHSELLPICSWESAWTWAPGYRHRSIPRKVLVAAKLSPGKMHTVHIHTVKRKQHRGRINYNCILSQVTKEYKSCGCIYVVWLVWGDTLCHLGIVHTGGAIVSKWEREGSHRI